MPFVAEPLVPGDLFNAAAKIAAASDQELFRLAAPAERLAALRQCWNEIAALGWSAMLVPESCGGVDGSLLDLAAVLEGAGRSALALPIADVCGAAPALLRSLTCSMGAKAALGELAAGRLRPGLSLQGRNMPSLSAVSGGEYQLDGPVLAVEVVPAPTHYLLLVSMSQAPVLVLLPAEAPGISARWHERIDGRPTVDLECQAVPVAAKYVLAQGDALTGPLSAASDLGALLVCVEAVAAIGALLEQTIGYLNTRVQFGVPLASFQVLRHEVVDMYVGYRNLRALVWQTLRGTTEAMEAGRPLPWRDIALAKLRLSEVGRNVAKAAIQLHGGMGMTEELAASRLAKRIMMADFEWGGTDQHAGRLLMARYSPVCN